MSSPSELLLDTAQLTRAVSAVSAGVTRQLGERDPVIVGVLKGAVVFMADLVRALPFSCQLDFLSISAFGRGRVRIESDLSLDIEARHVVLVEDIVDTGLTLSYLLRTLEARNPSSLSVATLLDRPARRLVEVPVKWTGVDIDDRFVIGYGMDFEGRYRNLREVWVVNDLSALVDDPDALESDVFMGGKAW